MAIDDRRRWPLLVGALAVLVLTLLLALTRGCTPGAPSKPEGPQQDQRRGSSDSAGTTPNEDGAVAAATEVATGSQRWLYLTDEEVESAVRDLAAPERADELSSAVVEDVRDAREGLGKSPGPVWWIVRSLAVRVDRLTPERADVLVWVVTVLSAREVAAPQAEWRRVAVDLVWRNGAWKLDAIRTTPGPTPMGGPGDRPWDAVPFDEALEGFERLDGEAVR